MYLVVHLLDTWGWGGVICVKRLWKFFARHNFSGSVGREQVSWEGKTPSDIMAIKLHLLLPVWKYTQGPDALQNSSWLHPSQGSCREVRTLYIHTFSCGKRRSLQWSFLLLSDTELRHQIICLQAGLAGSMNWWELLFLSYRVRREYLNLDIEDLLAENGITTDLLKPKPRMIVDENTPPEDLVSPYLPLEVSLFNRGSYPGMIFDSLNAGASVPLLCLLCVSLRCLTTRSLIPGPRRTGSPSAMRKDCIVKNPSLLKPCCLWETKHLLVHLLPFENTQCREEEEISSIVMVTLVSLFWSGPKLLPCAVHLAFGWRSWLPQGGWPLHGAEDTPKNQTQR